jgi:hypothetical protein
MNRPTDRPTDRPLAIDLFCGFGGWTEGLLAEGYRVIGFDNVRHVYGDEKYPGQLVLQDVLTIHGRQFKDAALIVGSSPCQEFSYRAMPWKRAKALPPPVLGIQLFEAQFRIQREAIEAAGHFIPLVVENVRGAQKYVGRSKYHFGSFHLWGDVPALMPHARKAIKVPTMGAGWYPPDHPKHVAGLGFNTHAARALAEGVKAGDRNKARASGGHKWTSDFAEAQRLNETEGQKLPGNNAPRLWAERRVQRLADATRHQADAFYCSSSGGMARKRASAMIAKIPLVLSRHIAASWYPVSEVRCEA